MKINYFKIVMYFLFFIFHDLKILSLLKKKCLFLLFDAKIHKINNII